MNDDILNLGLDSILVFEVVARLKSLKKAAIELSLSQPAVTHSLNKLEEKLGVQLCIRSRTHFTLTEPGKRLFELARQIRGQLKNYQSFLKDDEEFDGLFNLSVVDNFSNCLFDNSLSKVVEKFPKMKLNMQVQSSGEIQESVSKGHADIGFGIFHQKQDSLVYRKIGEEVLRYYISEKHSLWNKKKSEKKDVQDQKVAWVDTVFRDRSSLEAEVFVERPHQQMKVTSYTNNLNCALSLLKMGSHIVPMPEGYLESKKLDFKYRKLSGIKPIILAQSLVYRPQNAKASKVADYFIKICKP